MGRRAGYSDEEQGESYAELVCLLICILVVGRAKGRALMDYRYKNSSVMIST